MGRYKHKKVLSTALLPTIKVDHTQRLKQKGECACTHIAALLQAGIYVHAAAARTHAQGLPQACGSCCAACSSTHTQVAHRQVPRRSAPAGGFPHQLQPQLRLHRQGHRLGLTLSLKKVGTESGKR